MATVRFQTMLVNSLGRSQLVLLVVYLLLGLLSPVSLLLVVYDYLVLLSVLCLELRLKYLLVKLGLFVDAGAASAVVGALGPVFPAAAVFLITFVLAVAALSNE